MKWKDIEGFTGYQISETGMVRSFRPKNGRGNLRTTPRPIKPRPTSFGYIRYALYSGERGFTEVLAHREVAKAFIPNPKSFPEVNHLNGIKTDNRIENLEWTTKQLNMAHSRSVLFKCVCERHGRSKLTNDQVSAIRDSTDYNQKELAKKYGVHLSTIQRIKKNKSWRYLKEIHGQ